MFTKQKSIIKSNCKEAQVNNRYKIDTVHAESLEGNPLNSPVERDLNIYLPPGYYENEEKRYPVIYALNGHGGDNHSWAMTQNFSDKDFVLPLKYIPKKIKKLINTGRMANFKTLDNLIMSEELDPVIIVQPDPSLHVPPKGNSFFLKKLGLTKGSFYVNSQFTGNYMDYVIKDVINYIDFNYRTIPDKGHRAIVGGSMGGFGTLYLCLQHPELFCSAAALSPGNFSEELLELTSKTPLVNKILGKRIGNKIARLMAADIMDTLDLISSNDNPLVPTIKRDETGKILEMNMEVFKNWKKYDINNIIKKKPNSLKQVNIMLNCDKNDDYGLGSVVEKIHETLLELDINHQYELYSDPEVALSPHVLGILFHILPSIRFCLQHFAI